MERIRARFPRVQGNQLHTIVNSRLLLDSLLAISGASHSLNIHGVYTSEGSNRKELRGNNGNLQNQRNTCLSH